jgi:hypothetical protein
LRILLLIVVPPLLIIFCALVLMWIPLPRPLPAPLSSARNLMAAAIAGLLGVGYLFGLVVYVVGSTSRAGQSLDPELRRMGLEPEGYMLIGRRYRGDVGGRQVEVTYLPPAALQPAHLDIRVEANSGMRAAFGRTRPLLDCQDCPLLVVDDPGWENVQVYTQDDAGVRGLVADPTSGAAIRRLVGSAESQRSRDVYLQPQRVWTRVRGRGITGEECQRHLEDAVALAEVVEKVPES